MCRILKIFQRVVPVAAFLLLSGCGETAAGEANIGEINTSETDMGEAGTDETDTGKAEAYNADPTCLPYAIPDQGEFSADELENTDAPVEYESLSVEQLYSRLEEELGRDHVGGEFCITGSDVRGIWLTQEVFDAWEERELTDCELAVKQAEKDGRIVLRAGKYSLDDLNAFQELLRPFFCTVGEVGIYDTRLNAKENKICVRAHKNADFEWLYELVPEDAVCLHLFPFACWIVDL